MRLARRIVALSLLAVAGCGSEDEDGRLQVVATTTQAADIARHVGGQGVSVHGLLRPDADPHGYEPRPSDARRLAAAGLVVRSGGEVDEWLDDVVAGAGGDASEVTLIDSVETIEEDPHWWHDPLNGAVAAEALGRALGRADPSGRAGYARRARAYAARLQALGSRIAACMASVPAARRKIVTTHDSLAYFARRYDIEVVGALIPSNSSQAQPSARDTRRLIDQIKRERVKAIFPESSLDPDLERAVAREAGAAVGDPLWADSLGPRGSRGASYEGALEANADALVKGMSGGTRERC